MVDLSTTNVLLGIMAVVSVLEVLGLIALAIGGVIVYKRAMRTIAQVMTTVNDLERRQIEPLRGKIEDILADVKTVSARVSDRTVRVDHAISGTIDRVDETADRVRSSVRDKVNQATGVVRGVRAVIMSILQNESRPEPPAPATGRV